MIADDEKEGVLTVGELRKLLANYPDETLVESEGCDCDGAAGGVRLKSEGCILITRKET
jgi:hypothetical protein